MEWNEKIIGRYYEKRLLQQYYDSDKSELVALYGRRRVGKTYLIRCTFKDEFDFYFTGIYQGTKKTQLTEFSKILGLKRPPKDWFSAFDLLKEHLLSLNKEKVTVFLDELPWMDTPKSDFIQAFSLFWNMWPMGKSLLKLYVCGSSTSWMLDNFIGDKGGLYGRTKRSIYLKPFTLSETEQYLNTIKRLNINRRQVLDIYMMMGGIPYYLDMLDPSFTISHNVDILFFSQNAPLRTEYEFLFRSLYKNGVKYRKVVEIISKKLKGLSRDEIVSELGEDGGSITKILKDLESCDFIRSYTAFGKKKKEVLYQLTDLFSLFYLRFVKNSNTQDENYWSNLPEGQKHTWEGYAFEQVCLHHIREIKGKLGISGILSNVYSWSVKPFTDENGINWDGGQIDLLIDRQDDVINLCEIKYSSNEYNITKEYEKHIRERTSLFRQVSKTRKSLNITFISTYGIKHGVNSSIVQSEITMDDLFKSID
ncbi:MAG: ATP-binding protein [Candidatus Ornithospirochaeta sp.]